MKASIFRADKLLLRNKYYKVINTILLISENCQSSNKSGQVGDHPGNDLNMIPPVLTYTLMTY